MTVPPADTPPPPYAPPVSKFGRRDRIIGLAARCVGSRPVAKARGVRFGRTPGRRDAGRSSPNLRRFAGDCFRGQKWANRFGGYFALIYGTYFSRTSSPS